MRREDARRWVAGYRAAQDRERHEAMATGPEVGAAVASALALIALGGRLHGWPIPDDEIDRREDALVRERWDRLRAVLLGRVRAG
jgi:hypothetical protein